MESLNQIAGIEAAIETLRVDGEPRSFITMRLRYQEYTTSDIRHCPTLHLSADQARTIAMLLLAKVEEKERDAPGPRPNVN